MRGIRFCGECSNYSFKKHRCLLGAHVEENPRDPFFDDCPLPEVAPVVHGRWIIECDDFDCELMRCSVCGAEYYNGDNDTVDVLSNYCPNCGAKMDKEDNTDD